MCQQSSCYDLLSRMYQASNRWEEALQLAHTKDRINLKRTYYEYARYLEGEGIRKAKSFAILTLTILVCILRQDSIGYRNVRKVPNTSLRCPKNTV